MTAPQFSQNFQNILIGTTPETGKSFPHANNTKGYKFPSDGYRVHECNLKIAWSPADTYSTSTDFKEWMEDAVAAYWHKDYHPVSSNESLIMYFCPLELWLIDSGGVHPSASDSKEHLLVCFSKDGIYAGTAHVYPL
jgi:hypothetical protein